MSVYTRVDDRDLAALLADYALRLEHAQAARHGIENSTFLIDARAEDGGPRAVVLTVFEQFDGDALAPYLELLATLAAAVGATMHVYSSSLYDGLTVCEWGE